MEHDSLDKLLNNVDSKTNDVQPIDPFPDHGKEAPYQVGGPYSKLLENLQGNILKGHDRDHVVQIFFRFNTQPHLMKLIKKAISQHAKEITSARLQLEEWRRYHYHKIPGGVFVNFFLTAAGYRALGFSQEELEKAFGHTPFMKGMYASKDSLCDPDISRWEEPYRQEKGKEIHGMILIADDDDNYLGRAVRTKFEVLNRGPNQECLAEVVAIEHGDVMRDETQEPLEHFGFRDGLSNPMFLETDREKVTKYGGDSKWKSWAPLNLVLVKDPLSDDPSAAGSYLVYRKLEQHVRQFETIVRNLAYALGLNSEAEEDLEKVRALIMGRFKNGTPLALRSAPYESRYFNENYNNFDYEKAAAQCPFHVHSRKTNPRFPNEESRQRRIVRRGITYGSRNKDLEKQGLSYLPNSDVGLLFMCFQSDIEKQFEHIQKSMANNADFPKQGTGLDPIIGQMPEAPCSACNGNGGPRDQKCAKCGGTGKYRNSPPAQNWPMNGSSASYSYAGALSSCVTFKGGEYFFAPSISFLKNLDPETKTQGQSQSIRPQFQPADFQLFMERYWEETLGKKQGALAKREWGDSSND